MKQLIPALGQIFKTVDDLRDVENVAAAVKMYLAQDTHIDSECAPDDSLMGYLLSLGSSVKNMEVQLKDMIKNKSDAIF